MNDIIPGIKEYDYLYHLNLKIFENDIDFFHYDWFLAINIVGLAFSCILVWIGHFYINSK